MAQLARSPSDVPARYKRLFGRAEAGADGSDLSRLAEVADLWGRLQVPNPLPEIDGLLAATAIVHDLVLVTRNVKDVRATGARCLNPFVPA